MKATQIALVCIVCLFATSQAEADYKGSCLTKFVDLISSFFTRDQISELADTAMDEIIDQSPASDIISAMINKAVGILNSGQYSQFSSLMLKAYGQFGSYEVINATIQKCLNGVNPPVSKLYPQITDKIEAKSTHVDQCTAGFQFIDGKLNKKFMHNIVCACKKKLLSTEWTKATTLLKSYIKFDQLGFKV